MKRLLKSIDTSQLHVFKELLEANGIPAHINGENTARAITPFLMTEPSLWIYLDDQLEDALKLMRDPDYEVVSKVDMNEFYEVADDIASHPASLNAMLIYVAMTMGLVLLGLVVLFKTLEWMTT